MYVLVQYMLYVHTVHTYDTYKYKSSQVSDRMYVQYSNNTL